MKILPTLLVAAAALSQAQTGVSAASLTIATVRAPAINCIFATSCTVRVTDSTGNLGFTPLGRRAYLHTRTMVGAPGSPAAGKTAYLYRIDLTTAAHYTECVAGVLINFRSIDRLNYLPSGPTDMFVITGGGSGSIAPTSAIFFPGLLQVNFVHFVCAGQSSFYFGVSSSFAPVASTALLFAPGSPPFMPTKVRAP